MRSIRSFCWWPSFEIPGQVSICWKEVWKRGKWPPCYNRRSREESCLGHRYRPWTQGGYSHSPINGLTEKMFMESNLLQRSTHNSKEWKGNLLIFLLTFFQNRPPKFFPGWGMRNWKFEITVFSISKKVCVLLVKKAKRNGRKKDEKTGRHDNCRPFQFFHPSFSSFSFTIRLSSNNILTSYSDITRKEIRLQFQTNTYSPS